ncbi:MAG TPA: hypothetical protein PK819_06665 [Thermomicrobiales bacterium]|nr:hypothetical protein [Thermomicrobiales bacterium]
MDPERFDAFSRSLASRSSRRTAINRLSASGIAAGLLASLGIRRTYAASGTCSLDITATGSAGPNADTIYTGTLEFEIGEDGAVDKGTFTTDNGNAFDLVGQASGRSLNLRVALSDDQAMTFTGTADVDLVLCRGAVAGLFAGPDDGDTGSWRTGSGGDSSSSGGSSGSGSSDGGSSSGGGSSDSGSGGGSDSGGGDSDSGGGDSGSGGGDSGGGGTTDCPSGVICDGVCCQARDGFFPDAISCDSGCACTYSCQSAGCPNGGTGHSFTIGCDDRPNALCGEMCNFPDEDSCGGMTCADDEQLDVASCTCISGTACGPGQTNCGTDTDPNCRDLSVDGENCGSCGTVCPLGLCTNGVCGE